MNNRFVKPTLMLIAILAFFAIAISLALAPATVDAAKPPTRTPGPSRTATNTPLPPTNTPTPGPTATPGTCGATRNINVSTAAQLTSALSGAQPGDTIILADGTYIGHFVATVKANANCHVIVTGSSNAILNGNDNTSGYGFHLNGANYWELRGITITASKKGIMTDGANYNLIYGVTVYNIGEEGIHLRTSSTHNTIQNSTVHDTGRLTPDYGEAIYVGTASDTSDKSDYDQILGNHLAPNVTAEAIDVKEGTCCGLFDGNYMDSTGLGNFNYADSWIQANGNNWTYSNNTGRNPTNVQPPKFKDGSQIHDMGLNNGNNNTFNSNDFDVRTSGYGFWFQAGLTGNVVCTNNIVTNAGSGVANIPLTNCP